MLLPLYSAPAGRGSPQGVHTYINKAQTAANSIYSPRGGSACSGASPTKSSRYAQPAGSSTPAWTGQVHFRSTSKSSTSSFVSSVPLRLPTAHTSLVLEARMRHTTPPLPPLSSATRLRTNSPVLRSQSLTVPSSELVTTNLELNCRQVTALWCLLGPGSRGYL